MAYWVRSLIFFFCFGLSSSGWADEPPSANAPTQQKAEKPLWTGYIRPKDESEPGITGLKLSEKQIPVTLVAREGKLRPLIQVSGEYERADWKLFAQENVPIKLSPEHRFKIFAYLNGRNNELILTAKGPNGEKEVEHVYVMTPSAQEYEVASPWNSVMIGFGASRFQYFQSRFGNFQSWTSVLSVGYATPEGRSRFGLLTGFDLTVLNLAPKPEIDGSPQIFSGKLEGTYRFHYLKSPQWHTQMLFGLSYMTMISNGSPCGFANLMAPDVGLRATYKFTEKAALIGEARYIPISGLAITNHRGYDMGISWNKILPNFHRAQIGLSWIDYSYLPEANTTIQVDLVMIKFGYSL